MSMSYSEVPPQGDAPMAGADLFAEGAKPAYEGGYGQVLSHPRFAAQSAASAVSDFTIRYGRGRDWVTDLRIVPDPVTEPISVNIAQAESTATGTQLLPRIEAVASEQGSTSRWQRIAKGTGLTALKNGVQAGVDRVKQAKNNWLANLDDADNADAPMVRPQPVRAHDTSVLWTEKTIGNRQISNDHGRTSRIATLAGVALASTIKVFAALHGNAEVEHNAPTQLIPAIAVVAPDTHAAPGGRHRLPETHQTSQPVRVIDLIIRQGGTVSEALAQALPGQQLYGPQGRVADVAARNGINPNYVQPGQHIMVADGASLAQLGVPHAS